MPESQKHKGGQSSQSSPRNRETQQDKDERAQQKELDKARSGNPRPERENPSRG